MIVQVIQFIGAVGFGCALLGWFLSKNDGALWLIAVALFLLVAK